MNLFFEMIPSYFMVSANSRLSTAVSIVIAFTSFCAGRRNSFGVFLLHLNYSITLSLLDYDIGLEPTTLILLESTIHNPFADLTGL
jgi:hypothetical protein